MDEINAHARARFLRNLDWNLLKVFVTIARAGGVTKAARVLARQQSSVSSALKRLEDHLGVILCRRGPMGFELTEEGRIVLTICEEIEAAIWTIPSDFEELSRDVLTQLRVVIVSNLVSSRLDGAISLYSRTYPRSPLMINIAPCLTIPEMILSHEAEIGVAPTEHQSDQLRFTLLFREQHVPVCGPSHPLFGTRITDPAELAHEAFVLPGLDEAEPVRRYRQKYGWGQCLAGESLDLNEVRRMILASVGIALLPREFLEDDIRAGRIWQLMKPSPQLQDDVFLITNPNSSRRRAVERFLDLLPVLA